MNRARSGFAFGVAVGLVCGLVLAAILGVVTGVVDDRDDPAAEARQVIEDNYFEEVDPEALEGASIRGMVDELRKRYDDPLSHYFSPQQLARFEAASSGRFSGVGLTVNEVSRGLRVASVLPDTPAERVGIDEGDLITAVDGRSIAGLSADVSTARIKGPPGTDVELRLLSLTGGERDVTLERASVRVPAVAGSLRRADGRPVAYVRFATFTEGAHGDLRSEVERLYRRGAEGLVLDLRGNGGGLLNEAILSSSIFVEDGVVVSTESRTQGDREFEAVGEALDPRPTVVLTNRDTASASEILTAALAAADLATVVGTRTYGKGSFQEVIDLSSGGALDLTIGAFLTADGVSLAGEGIEPDVRAKDDPRTESDEGLREGLRVLGAKLRGDG